MNFFSQILHNQILLTAIVSWALAQLIKIGIELIRTHRINWQLIFATGGMPSSHSSLVVALATAMGLRQGFDSPIFAVATVLAFVVLYDAQGIRRQAGNQARIINRMLQNVENAGIKVDKNLKELLGHTPIQVVGGTILGIIVALIMN
ncbi:divergent PAP2 family protein [Lactococcus cremoris]|uniref:Divergent PAP2 family protein n=1 Tax=Lactococcus lactis subsp. cremoris TaxID=1359 RepID=A0AAX4AJH6_LACLC|nr:divergent PAP2 family protein [Lactococcus cremoris]KGH34600.1 membrane protein [Lactococcus cremoris]QSE62598.1 divergent PAP2 family protein [Lactococcus cremoris]WMX70400.1 divergent PAP2 family protein [Lactococcus cremoris]